MEETKTIEQGTYDFYTTICTENPDLSEDKKVRIDIFLGQVRSYLVDPKATFTSSMEMLLRETTRPYIDVRDATNHGTPRLPRLQSHTESHTERVATLINQHIIYEVSHHIMCARV